MAIISPFLCAMAHGYHYANLPCTIVVLAKSLKTNVKPKPCRLFKQLLNCSAFGTVFRLAGRGTSQFIRHGANPKAAKCMVIAQPCIWQWPLPCTANTRFILLCVPISLACPFYPFGQNLPNMFRCNL